MDKDVLKSLFVALIGLVILILFVGFYPDSNSLSLLSYYSLSNFSSKDNSVKVFMLYKNPLNESVVLYNDNDITQKILISRLPYD